MTERSDAVRALQDSCAHVVEENRRLLARAKRRERAWRTLVSRAARVPPEKDGITAIVIRPEDWDEARRVMEGDRAS